MNLQLVIPIILLIFRKFKSTLTFIGQPNQTTQNGIIINNFGKENTIYTV